MGYSRPEYIPDSPEVVLLKKQKEEALAAAKLVLETLRKQLNDLTAPIIPKIQAAEMVVVNIDTDFGRKIRDAQIRARPTKGQIPQHREVTNRWINAWLFDRFAKGRKIFDLTAEQLAKDFEVAVKDGWTPTF